MTTIYSDYQKDRTTWLLGMTGGQATAVSISGLPFFYCLSKAAWAGIFVSLLAWLLVVLITVPRPRGRSVIGWGTAAAMFSIGELGGWTMFRPRTIQGKPGNPDRPDLPGRLQSLEILDGPPTGPDQARIGIVKDNAAKTWAVTALITHPGIGMLEQDDRDHMGRGMSQLLELAARTELVDELIFIGRTVPDDGAERQLYVDRHEAREDNLARRINRDLANWLTRASVRTEQYFTILVTEKALGRAAREAGGGFAGRARILYSLMGEMEAQLKSGMGVTSVAWLPSPQLATVTRTGFAPGDRAGIIKALDNPSTSGTTTAGGPVPWGQAGPAGAQASARYYAHDAWWSVSSTLILPDRGAAMGALAGVLMPSEPDERRSFMVSYPVLNQAQAQRKAMSQEWKTDMAQGVREKAKRRASMRTRLNEEKSRNLDAHLAHGRALVRPYAVATITVPQTMPISDFGRRLDGSIRNAGFAPLRMDLSHDLAFCASVIPLGISLVRSTTGGFAALFEGGAQQ